MKTFFKFTFTWIVIIGLGYLFLSKSCSIEFIDIEPHTIPAQPKQMRTDNIYCINNFTECHYMFSNNIQDPKYYTDLLMFLYTAPKTTTLYLHLVGHGGVSLSATLINNAIKTSDATVVSIVEGPVYSAHAVLALSGHRLEVRSGTLFMFHIPAYSKKIEDICVKYVGQKDRGQDKYDKCIQYLIVGLQVSTANSRIIVKDVLTEQELNRLDKGFDVYVTGEEMKRRINR